jgi:hypothetical protein
MFVRKWTWKKADGGTSTYLGIVRTYYQGGKVHQQRLCHLGNLNELREKGEIDRLIEGLARFSLKRWVVVDGTGPIHEPEE